MSSLFLSMRLSGYSDTWQRMEKISWVDKVTNAEILQKVEENRNILNTAQQRELGWIEMD